MPPQNMPLWHKDYFELKATEKKQIKEKLSTPLLPPPGRAGQSLNQGRQIHSLSPEAASKEST